MPVACVLEEIQKLRYCADVTQSELIELLKELIGCNLYEGPPPEMIDGASLVWKSCEHPSLDAPGGKAILL